jgi:nucleoside-diphosphate-sugar epimerase
MTVIAVTGGSGFVGRHLCPKLVSQGHQVLEIGRTTLLSDYMSRTLKGVDALIHLVARAHILTESCSDPETQYRAVNVGLTERVARAAEIAGVQRFVFISSAGVLGASSPKTGLTDASVPCPHDFYTASKLEAERWLRSEMAATMGIAILRPPLIYGPGASGNFRRLLRMALKGWPLPIGGLDAQRTMIGVRNMIDLIAVVATDSRASGFTMLAADQEAISVADLFRELARYAGRQPQLPSLPVWVVKGLLQALGRRADVQRLTDPFVLHPSIAHERFGWSPPFTLAEELRWTVQSELEERNG